MTPQYVRQCTWVRRATLSGIALVLASWTNVAAQVMDHYPLWSPDGRWILFGSNRTGQTEIYIVSPAGDDLRRITRNDVADVNVGWTDDGRILFASDRDGAWVQFSVAVDGSDPEPAPARDSILATSPHHDWLVFSSRREGGPTLYVGRRGNGQARRLSSAGHVVQPTFSPNGRRIVFEERDDGIREVHSSRIVVVPLEGSSRIVAAEGGTDPHWSPDGETILYKQWDPAANEWIIAVVNSRGGEARLLRPGVHPDWSPTVPGLRSCWSKGWTRTSRSCGRMEVSCAVSPARTDSSGTAATADRVAHQAPCRRVLA